jgi:hypothetical protein
VKKHILDLGFYPCVHGTHWSRGPLGTYSHTLGLADGRIAVFPVNSGQRNNAEKADGD